MRDHSLTRKRSGVSTSGALASMMVVVAIASIISTVIACKGKTLFEVRTHLSILLIEIYALIDSTSGALK